MQRGADLEAVADAGHADLPERLIERFFSAAARERDQHGQLERLSDRDWDQLNVAMGLKAAIKSALEDQAALSDPDAVNTEEIPDDLRRFLLIPDSDGTEPKRLRRMSAFFLAILTVAPEERQGLVGL